MVDLCQDPDTRVDAIRARLLELDHLGELDPEQLAEWRRLNEEYERAQEAAALQDFTTHR